MLATNSKVVLDLALLRYTGKVFVPDESLERDRAGLAALTRSIARADVRARYDYPMLGWVLELTPSHDP